MSRVLCCVLLLACSSQRRAAPALERDDATSVIADAAPIDATLPDAPPAPRTLDDALAALRARGFAGAADSIARRVAQKPRKMKLSPDEALAAALALLDVAEREAFRALVAVMPRSTVELARAVRERGVTRDEAEVIARYLVRVGAALAFERLPVFDENHSHVTGREWHEIDYSGEGMTWQGQRDDWSPRGVTSFKRASYIHAYFVGAEKLPHWMKVYRPRGKLADVTPP